MQKLATLLVGLIIALIFNPIAIVSGQESDNKMCVPLGTIVLEPPEGVESKRTPVDFPHSKHFGFECRSCHHKWEGEAQIKGCTTSGCHDVLVSPTKSEKGSTEQNLAIRYFKTAYHEQCIGCHKIMKLKNRKLEISGKKLEEQLPPTGPTSCVQCHPKE
jgi:hypothetical protein